MHTHKQRTTENRLVNITEERECACRVGMNQDKEAKLAESISCGCWNVGPRMGGQGVLGGQGMYKKSTNAAAV